MKVIRPPKYFTLYLHRNKDNGKCYVGQTSQAITKRWQDGNGYKGCTAFNNAIQKYGWDGFEHIILRENVPYKYVDLWERYYIKKYHSLAPNGYNLQTGGNANKSISNETRKRLSESHKGLPISEGTLNNLRKMAQEKKGTHLSEETKRKLSVSQKGITRRKGFKLSDEHKRKIGKANKGKMPSTYGKHLSQSTKDKISKARKGSYIKPNYDEMMDINVMYWEKGMSLREIERQTSHYVAYISKVVYDSQFITANKTKYMNHEFIKVKDVANILGVNVKTVYRNIKSIASNTIKFNGMAYISQEDFNLLKEKRNESNKERKNLSC